MDDTTTSAGRKPRTPWTRDDEATLRGLTGSGMTDGEIAAQMDRDVKLIGRKRRALNIDRGVPADLSAMLARVGARARAARP